MDYRKLKKPFVFCFFVLLLLFISVYSIYSMDFHWRIGVYDVARYSNGNVKYWQEFYIEYGNEYTEAYEYFLGLKRTWIVVYFLNEDGEWNPYFVDTVYGAKPTVIQIYKSVPNIVIWLMKTQKDALLISYNYLSGNVRVKYHPKHDKNYWFYKSKLKKIKRQYERYLKDKESE